MLNKKTVNEDFSVINGSCLSVSIYVHWSLLSVANYPNAMQRYEYFSEYQWIGCKNLRKLYVKPSAHHCGEGFKPLKIIISKKNCYAMLYPFSTFDMSAGTPHSISCMAATN